jgi:glycosyltransferase involved in cell wall biosynthesis
MGRETNVAILLSTRNGAEFLNEQLESLLGQSHTQWQIFWRDDGSSDETPELMREFAMGSGVGRVMDLNDNLGHVGITASFMGLLRKAPRGRIVAFADQDDVWLPEKLARGIAALEDMPAELPGLYCARQHLVAADLQHVKESPRIRGSLGFPQSMTQNVATGCTVMLNGQAARLLADAENPVGTLHDWWAYLLVSAAGGKVVLDDTPTVLYRQHAHNAVGVPLSRGRRAWAALQRGPSVFMTAFRAHMEMLEAQPGLLTPDARETLGLISAGLHDGFGLRIKALRHPGLKRQSWAETQLFRLWFLLG